MTLQLEVVGPALVLLAGALLVLLRPAGLIFVAAEAACLGLMLRLWQLSTAGSLVLAVYQPLPDVQVVFRVDHLGIFFAAIGTIAGLLVSVPWLLNPLQRRRGYLGWLLLAQSGMVVVALAGGLETLAAGWGIAAAGLALLVVVRRIDGVAGPARGAGASTAAVWHVVAQFAAALLLLAGAMTVEVAAGTGGFDAIPVGAIDVRAFLLIVAAPVIALLGLGTMVRALKDPLGCGLAMATVAVPMACYVLVRLYDLGDGRLPDPRIGVAMVLLGGVASLWFALTALWAVDLGATLTRIVQAAAALLLVAAGAGSGLGVAAVATGAISVVLGASLAYAVLDAGRGRLPSFPPGRSAVLATATSVAVLLALAWTGGLGGGLSTSFRIATVQAALSAGDVSGLAAIPALAGTAVMIYAAYAAGRFGGGAAPSRTDLIRIVLLGAAMPATSAAAVAQIYPIVAPIAASALRITSGEVTNAVQTSPAGSSLIVAFFAGVVVVLAVAARPGGPLDLREGLSGAPGHLPPPLTVLPRVWGVRLLARAEQPARAATALVARHWLLTSALLVAGAGASVTSMLR